MTMLYAFILRVEGAVGEVTNKMGKWEFSYSTATSCIVLVALILNSASLCNGGISSTYVRSTVYPPIDMPFWSPAFAIYPGYNAPQQVSITQGDYDGQGVIVTWTTHSEPGSNTVFYWPENSTLIKKAEGMYTTYTFAGYKSGYIHHTYLLNLLYSTKYYYEVGIGNTTRQFWFTTPPALGPDAAYTFGLIGDLGQTFNSNTTLTHYQNDPLTDTSAQALLYLGDFSYADDWPLDDGTKWDTWGTLIERIAAYQAWIWTVGNHEIEYRPALNETVPFKPMTHRYFTPYNASGSSAPFWYSVRRASAHIIVLASYSAFGDYTPQYRWLETELKLVNRNLTPWLLVCMHAPLYNSYAGSGYMQGETMRVQFEKLFVEHKVDAIFAGHIHAYERSYRISNIAYNITNADCTPICNDDAPVYLTIGDGGNIEGLTTEMTEPQPNYSAYREASYGHGMFSIKNRTHAYFTWNRNQDDYAVEADTFWFYNRVWYNTNATNNCTNTG